MKLMQNKLEQYEPQRFICRLRHDAISRQPRYNEEFDGHSFNQKRLMEMVVPHI